MARKKKPKKKVRTGPHVWKRAFLAALREHGNVTHAASQAGVTRQAAQRAREDDEAFSAEWADALVEAGERLEMVALERARDGWEEPVFFKGEPCGTIRKFSNTLMIFLLKGIFPEKYRERFDHAHKGEIGHAVQIYLPDNGR